MNQMYLCGNSDDLTLDKMVGNIILTYNNMKGKEYKVGTQMQNAENQQIIALATEVEQIKAELVKAQAKLH